MCSINLIHILKTKSTIPIFSISIPVTLKYYAKDSTTLENIKTATINLLL